MCGILGWCNFNGQKNLNKLRKASEFIKSRGPDAFGEYTNSKLDLIHTRLSIIDINKRSDQPLRDDKSGNVISYNGEIYNFKSIKKTLEESHNIIFKTESDTEVVLKGYEVFGIDGLLSKLDGMYAFAIWDENKKKLFLARDKFGEKPLFYTNDVSNGLIFSSSITSLLNLIDQKKISKESLFNYLNLSYLIGNKTFFDNIKQLEPSSYIMFNQNLSIEKIKVKKYWKLENLVLRKKNNYDINEATSIFNELFSKSVSKRLVSDIHPGSFLSGGVDSSLIAIDMAKNSESNFVSHNLKFDQKNFDESYYAKQVSNLYGIKTYFHEMPNAKTIAIDFDNIIEAMDQPLADTAFISNYYISKMSSKISKVILSGDGGDELFGGYETYTADYLKGLVNFLPNSLNKFVNKNLISKLKSNYEKKIDTSYKLKIFFYHCNLKEEHAHILWRSIFNNYELSQFSLNEIEDYSKRFLNELSEEHKLVNKANLIDRNIFLDLKTWFPNNILTKIDRSSMFHSQETRLPFLDPEIIKFSFNLNQKLKAKIFNKKIILRNSLQDKMGKKFIKRKKAGFNTPIGHWMIKDKNFNELTMSLLKTDFMKSLIPKEFVDDLIKKHINRIEDNSFKLFNLIVLSQWVKNNNLQMQ
tara:strand:+ start:13175 stop:15094 length:1920 start_codon:yes stop_codon:yes gene_type:complete